MKPLLLIVICLLMSSFLWTDGKPKIKSTTQYEYLTPGNYTDNAVPELFYKTITTFNPEGKITGQLMFNMRQKDSLIFALEYIYDNQGRLLIVKNKGATYQEVKYETDRYGNELVVSYLEGRKNSLRLKNSKTNIDTVLVFDHSEVLLARLIQKYNAGRDTVSQLDMTLRAIWSIGKLWYTTLRSV